VAVASSDISSSDFFGFVSTTLWTSIVSLGLGLLWLTLVHNAPVHAPKIACLLAVVSLLVVAIFSIFVQNT